MIREARQRDIDRISLSVEADNPAINLYRHVGFVEQFRVSDSPRWSSTVERTEMPPGHRSTPAVAPSFAAQLP